MLVRILRTDVLYDIDLIRQRLGNISVDLCGWAKKKLEPSKGGLTAMKLLSAASKSFSTFMAGSADTVRVVQPRSTAETCWNVDSMHGNSDFMESMVSIGPHYAKAFSARMNNCRSVTIPFRLFTLNAARNLRLAYISFGRWYTVAQPSAEICRAQSQSRYLSRCLFGINPLMRISKTLQIPQIHL